EGEPEPPIHCDGCGRSRPADLSIIRFVDRPDGPQWSRSNPWRGAEPASSRRGTGL
ncbi:MAG: hypothetical protein AVDCRST_MAG33-846, partial [uncultured Thermomicrobiales bacterium]